MAEPTSVIIIPARMASSRLPGKPLADIAGKPMVIHVMEQAQKSKVGEVYVACAEQKVADVVEAYGGNAIMTDPAHTSGTDRVYEAYQKLDRQYDIIVNVQGDLPNIDPNIIEDAVSLLDHDEVEISTLVAKITDEEEIQDPNVVKAVFTPFAEEEPEEGRALYFSRSAVPYGEGDYYHHIGLYGYTHDALEEFVRLPSSSLEQREKLEQLRALENNMCIGIRVVKTIPLGVDTPDDLLKMQAFLSTIQ